MSKKILIIDDDRILLETASQFLKHEGYEVIKAHDGLEGISFAKKTHPDIIYCDIYMPNMDGYEVFKKLQTNYSTSQIPFIFMTSKSEKKDIRHGMNLGADDYITKPFNFEELKETTAVRLEKFEKTIKQSEIKYRILFERAGDAIFILKTAKGEIVDSNQISADLLGFSKEEFLLKTWTDLLRETDCQKRVNKWKNGNKQDVLTNIETWITGKDEKKIPVAVSFTNIEISNKWFIFLIIRNLSEIKEKEKALKESEERYRELVENTGEGIGIVDLHENFTYANPAACEIFGFSSDALLGRNFLELLAPSSPEEIKRQTQLWKTGKKSIFETEVIRPDGEHRWIVVTTTPQYDAVGKLTTTFAIFRDITKRKLYERELIIAKEKAEESDRLKTSILANTSHELRTPLNGILGFAEILHEELKDTDYEAITENIYQSGHRLMTTLNSIIILSQLESGEMVLSLKPMALQDGILSVVKCLQSLADKKHLTINTSGVKPWQIQTDEHFFKQLLGQILDNSIKFTEQGGVTIETFMVTEQHENWLVVKISDTGIGISKDYFDLIFQEFRQVSEGFGRRFQGSGIGLTICKKIIDLLHGKITLESVERIRSSFSVWLPYKPVSGKSRKGKSIKVISENKKIPLNRNLTEEFCTTDILTVILCRLRKYQSLIKIR